MIKFLRRLVVVLLISYIGLVVYFYGAQRDYIYFPFPQDFDDCPALRAFDRVQEGDTRMYVKKGGDTWVVFYHGNAGSACDRDYATELFSGNYSFVIPEYIGYSNDDRLPSEAGLLANADDVRAFLLKVNAKKVIVTGESLGAAVAVYHDYRTPSDALLLISPFKSLEDMAKLHYPYLPVGLLLKDHYRSYEWIAGAKRVLIVHGEEDDIIPIGSARSLYDAIQSEEKRFAAIPSAGHNDIIGFPQVKNEILAFLNDF